MRTRIPGMTRSLTALAVLALLALPLAAGADKGKGHYGMHMDRMAEKLELTDAQREQWKALHEAHHPRMQQLREAVREQHEALREVAMGEFDEAAASAAARRLGDLVAESALERARMHAQLHEVLTEEQRAKLAEYHEGKHGKGHHGKKKDKGEKRGEETATD